MSRADKLRDALIQVNAFVVLIKEQSMEGYLHLALVGTGSLMHLLQQ